MAWVTRGGRAYEYRSIRRGGRVTSEYVGGGSIPAESAEFFRRLDSGRRMEREADRAEWEAEWSRLAEAERQLIQIDDAYDELAATALLASGHHRPQRGRWRRRRKMTTEIQTLPTDPPLVSEAEMTDLLDRIERAEGDEKKAIQEHAHQGIQLLLKHARAGVEAAVPALRVLLARRPQRFGNMEMFTFAAKGMASAASSNDAFLTDVLLAELRRTAAEVAGPDPSPLERLLAERVALAWFDAQECDCRFLKATGDGCSIAKADYLTRQKDRATARFLRACQAMATVRRLALPVLQIHMGGPTASVPDVLGNRTKHLTPESN